MNPTDLTRIRGVCVSQRILERDNAAVSLNDVAMTIEN
jgi:hypothetical protein